MCSIDRPEAEPLYCDTQGYPALNPKVGMAQSPLVRTLVGANMASSLRIQPITDVDELLNWAPGCRAEDAWCRSSCSIAQARPISIPACPSVSLTLAQILCRRCDAVARWDHTACQLLNLGITSYTPV